MRLFDFFTRRSSTRSEIDEANAALLAAAEESLDATLTLAKLQLREKVKMWDLENPSLLLTLGYIAGFIDSAYQSTRPTKYDERRVEQMYIDAIKRNLGEIEGAALYIKNTMQPYGSKIGGLQGFPLFVKGTMAGGNDFVNLVNQKRTPLSLVRLLDN